MVRLEFPYEVLVRIAEVLVERGLQRQEFAEIVRSSFFKLHFSYSIGPKSINHLIVFRNDELVDSPAQL